MLMPYVSWVTSPGFMVYSPATGEQMRNIANERKVARIHRRKKSGKTTLVKQRHHDQRTRHAARTTCEARTAVGILVSDFTIGHVVLPSQPLKLESSTTTSRISLGSSEEVKRLSTTAGSVQLAVENGL